MAIRAVATDIDATLTDAQRVLSLAAAEALRGRYPHLSVLHRIAKEGLGRAYVHGFKVALAAPSPRVPVRVWLTNSKTAGSKLKSIE